MIKTGCRFLMCLNLTGCHQLNDSALECIASQCLELRDINCSGAFEVTNLGVIYLLRGCRSLWRLDASYCWRLTNACLGEVGGVSMGVSSEGVSSSSFSKDDDSVNTSSFRIGNQLEKLLFVFCYQLTESLVDSLVKFPKLKHVNLSHCQHMTLSMQSQLQSHSIHALFEGCPLIELISPIIDTEMIE